MTEKITFYHNPVSRGRIVHWMLEEVAAPYEVKLLSFEKGEHKKPDYLAINPMGKIPAIVHRGVVVTECAAICAYLADAFPASRLAPALEEPARGTYYRWLFFGAGCAEPAVVDKIFARPPPERKGAIGYGTYEDAIDTIEKALSPGPFILGNQFSAADVYIASQIAWGIMAKGIDPRPSFEKYVARCTERPAFQRALVHGQKLDQELKARS
jgi:glutathione S-transferase